MSPVIGFPCRNFYKGFRSIVGYYIPHKSLSWIFKGLKEPWHEIAALHEGFLHPQTFTKTSIWFKELIYPYMLNLYIGGEEEELSKYIRTWTPIIEALVLAELKSQHPELYQLAFPSELASTRYLASKMITINNIGKRIFRRLKLPETSHFKRRLSVPDVISSASFLAFFNKITHDEGLDLLTDKLLNFLEDTKVNTEDLTDFFLGTGGSWHDQYGSILSLCTVLNMIYLLTRDNANIQKDVVLLDLLFYTSGVQKKYVVDPLGLDIEIPLYLEYYASARKDRERPYRVFLYKNIPTLKDNKWRPLTFSDFIYLTLQELLYSIAGEYPPTPSEMYSNDMKLCRISLDNLLNKIQLLSNKWDQYQNNWDKTDGPEKGYYDSLFERIETIRDLDLDDDDIQTWLVKNADHSIKLLSEYNKEEIQKTLFEVSIDSISGIGLENDLRESTNEALNQFRSLNEKFSEEKTELSEVLNALFDKKMVNTYKIVIEEELFV